MQTRVCYAPAGHATVIPRSSAAHDIVESIVSRNNIDNCIALSLWSIEQSGTPPPAFPKGDSQFGWRDLRDDRRVACEAQMISNHISDLGARQLELRLEDVTPAGRPTVQIDEHAIPN